MLLLSICNTYPVLLPCSIQPGLPVRPSHYPVQYPNRACGLVIIPCNILTGPSCGPVIIPCNIPSGPVNYPDKKVPIPDTPGYPFTTGLYTSVNFCAENGADAVVLQSVDQSVLGRCLLSRSTLQHTQHAQTASRPAKSPWAQPFFRGSASTV